MSQVNYNQVISEIKTFDLPDQLRFLVDIATLIRKKASQVKLRSILEIQGKGKNIWEGRVKPYDGLSCFMDDSDKHSLCTGLPTQVADQYGGDSH